MIDSTVSENSAGRDGGGTFNTSLANLTLTDVHLAHNVAGQNGGGLYNAGSASIGSSIFSGNKAAKKQRKKVPDTFFGPGRAIKQTGRSVHHRLG